MSEFQQFPGFSAMPVSDGTFRVSWDSYHERMTIEYIKHGIHAAIYLSLKQAEDAGYELVRIADQVKEKKQQLAKDGLGEWKGV